MVRDFVDSREQRGDAWKPKLRMEDCKFFIIYPPFPLVFSKKV